jgi:hypothetical protein
MAPGAADRMSADPPGAGLARRAGVCYNWSIYPVPPQVTRR